MEQICPVIVDDAESGVAVVCDLRCNVFFCFSGLVFSKGERGVFELGWFPEISIGAAELRRLFC